MAESTSIVIPSEIVLRHRSDDWTEAQVKNESEQLRVAKAALFVDKVRNEKIIEDLSPKIETLKERISKLNNYMEVTGRALIDELSVNEEFAAVKKALRELKIRDIDFNISYESVNIDAGEVNFTRKIGEKGSGYYSKILTGHDVLKFTTEMKACRTELREFNNQLKDLERQIIEARTALRDRANRQSDVEGVIALRNLTADEKVTVKDLAQQLATGLNAHKLLGDKSS